MHPRRRGMGIGIATAGLIAAGAGLGAAAQTADTSAFDRAALDRVSQPPLGLPPVPVPPDNPLTAEKIALGRKLFFDRRLSHNGTISCGMCHVPEQGFTSNELATAVGIEGRTVRRNSPTIVNTAYFTALFHDGREHSLELQALAPLVAGNEMGNPALGVVVDRLRRLPDYAGLFEKAFGRGPGVENFGQAIAAWQRTLIAGDSPFDQWRYGKRAEAIDAAAKRGFALFSGKAGCAGCHTVGEKHALFTDGAYHNTGIGYYNSVLRQSSAGLKVEIAPGKHAILDARALAAVSEPLPSDLGRYEVSLAPGDRWAYKTPSLRNIALTAPYMHDGSLASLREVVRFYNRGAYRHDLLDPAIRALDLGSDEVNDLVAFLESLTSPAMPRLVRDARSVAVGNP
jgi:cytochrome c peroxidase